MAKNKEKKAGKRMKKKELVSALMDFFHSKPDEVLSLKYIFEQLHLTTHPLKMLCRDILSDMLLDDYITEVEKSKYKLNNHGVEMIGTFQRKSNGKNSFIPEGGGDPIFVAERNSAHAMNNDKVRISFYAKRRGCEAEGEVIEVLERANDTFVGTLEVGSSYAFLVTENRTLANDIFIPKEKLKGGKTGDKAIVKVVEWPDKAKNPIGQVIDILGKAGDNTTEMHAILAEFGLPYVYPSSVEKAADKIPAEISDEEIAKREDFRNVTTFTIDPKDAKDFDDALSIRKLKDGLWEVGVHIRVSCRPYHPDASRTSLQLHLLPASRRRKAGVLRYLQHQRKGRCERLARSTYSNQVRPPFYLRGSTASNRNERRRLQRRNPHAGYHCQSAASEAFCSRSHQLRPLRSEV